ncbi:MAG: aspartate-semialdehyde dehydrogenase [Alphaproteobacteria bacterium]|nr:aspartate-semialdehyde dehydrogenase [Alphaproteobacteria bacterium]
MTDSSDSYPIAVLGATGNVGREMLAILAERDFPVTQAYALASKKSVGKQVSFGDKDLTIQDAETFDYSQVRLVFSSAGAAVSAQLAPKITSAGAVLIDNTSHFRMDEDVPLVVPEVNPHALVNYKARNIIANPNCSTIQMVMALKPIHDAVPIKRVVVSTYQSVSGGGVGAMDELFNQTKGIYVNDSPTREHFTKQIAFNVIPHIDSFMDDGATKEEWKMKVETRKIMEADIAVHANCVRMPVFIGHGEMVNIELTAPMSDSQASEILMEFEGLVVIDHRADEGYVTPLECAGEDGVYISRIREDDTVPYGLSMWVVADNLRKGAALNAVQIAEKMLEMKLL